MKKIIPPTGPISLSIALMSTLYSYRICSGNETKWKASPFEHKAFIENRGQFDNKIKSNSKIFYSAQLGKVHAYFTSNGITYRYDEIKHNGEEEEKEGGEKPEVKTYFVSATWENANANTAISAEEKQNDYYTYSENNVPVKAELFKKIIYKNIYNGIDIEYFFPQSKEGIKYNIICHAGADISQLKLKYEGAKKIFLDENGNLVIKTSMGDFTEHAPFSFSSDTHQEIASSFSISVKGNVISFSVNTSSIFHLSSSIIIDPWVSNPLFSSVNNAVDLDFDDAGNVYAAGSSQPFQIVKFSSAGTKLWTYNVPQASSTIDYGCFAVDKTSGSCYFFKGWEWVNAPVKIFKINTNGNLVTSKTTPYPLEFLRAKYDRCNHKFIIASGGWNNPNAQVSTIDTNLNNLQTYNPLGISGCCFDASLLAIDPSGNDFYLGMVNGTGNITQYPYNSLTKLPMASPGNASYIKSSGYHFSECAIVWTGVQQCGFNGMAASPSWLYLWDGSTLKKFDKNTGNVSATNVVHIPQYTFWQNNNSYLDTTIVTNWGGLDVDMCDNIYAGDKMFINVYNSSLALTGSFSLPDTVYDVKLHQDFKRLYACGQGFVTCINLPPPTLNITPTNSSNCACSGIATANLSACTTNGVNYLWSNGQTTQTITGLCPGNYSVAVTLNGPACTTFAMNFSDSVTIHGGGNISSLVNNTTICSGQTATLTANGGGNYSWSTGATNNSISVSPTVTSNYTVIVSNGTCADTAVAQVTVNPGTPVTTSGNSTICIGSSVTLSASGSSNYSWSTGSTTSSIIVSPTTNTTYTVVSNSSSACNSPATVSVNVSPPPVANATSATVCAGQNAILSASGGGNYLWSNGATTSSINVTAAGNYTVTVSVGTCKSSATANLVLTPAPTVLLVDDQFLCNDEALTLDAGNPGASYLWSTGETSQSITVSGAGTFWVIVGMNNCLASDTVKTFIAPAVHLFDSSLCSSSPILLDAGNGANSYLWSNGSTSQTISVDVSGTYWVLTQFGNCVSGDTAEITGEMGVSASLYVPNAFTPNGDHLNEIFLAQGTGIKSFNMNIFDRWGNLLFISDDINKGWNGKIQGGNYLFKKDGKEVSQEDVYIWKINYTTQCFPKKILKEIGSVTIIK